MAIEDRKPENNQNQSEKSDESFKKPLFKRRTIEAKLTIKKEHEEVIAPPGE